ncbi:MAG: glycosyltransferase family 2 protein [Patescibacteria group bacterium]|nr:glycosyltransferase family 2 protein [Patescibacteria group bacterium]MCL5431570.1 glycosyltransferase family 2 protein [Patescibacteria group bacterium]
MKTFVIIPAYNEAETIANVIADLRRFGYWDIVVVNDGSRDDTGKIARRLKVTVLTHVLNRGLGAALGTGFAYAQKTGADVLVTFDADGQHKAKDIKKLLDVLVKKNVDVVIGSRTRQRANMPLGRRLLNFLSNVLTLILFQVWSSDSQSGLRVFNKKALECINIKTDKMEVSSEFFKEIRDNHLKFAEVPISAVYTAYGMLSSKQGEFASARISWKLFLRLFR